MAMQKRFKVAFADVFPNSAFLKVGPNGPVEPVLDFTADRRPDGSRPQQVDPPRPGNPVHPAHIGPQHREPRRSQRRRSRLVPLDAGQRLEACPMQPQRGPATPGEQLEHRG